MRYAKNCRNNWPIAVVGAALICLAVLISLITVVLFAGCTTTVTPRIVASLQASWDGTNQNSGFIGFTDAGGIITPHARDRYNGLIELYGKKFIPPITFDYGISQHTNENYIIAPQALSDFAQMNRWYKSTR